MKWIILTGDSGDLGGTILRTLLDSREYAVIGLSRRFTPEMEQIRQDHPGRYQHISVDLSQPQNISALYLEKIKKIGPLYGLVNNAAFPYDDIVTNADLPQLETMFKINLYSPILLTKYAIRDMLLHNTCGSLVHITSVSAHTGYKGLSMYAATKGALEAFSRTVAREWGARGIRSNCVAPGFMETRMSSSLSAEQKERIYRRTSLKRPADCDSVARTVKFLLSEESSSITGTVIRADSGTI